MTEPTAAVVVEDLTKRYGHTLAADDVNFEVAAGELFGVLGPNGAGKTTVGHGATLLRARLEVAVTEHLAGSRAVRRGAGHRADRCGRGRTVGSR